MERNTLINSKIDETATLYHQVRIKESVIENNASVGDFSKVDFTNLGPFVRIDRLNHVFESTIGKHSYTGQNVVILKARIGSFCSISWNVSIGGANHDYRRIVQHSLLYNPYDHIRPPKTNIPYNRFEEECVIGNDVWLGSGCIITRGVKIGDGSVVAANAVVTKDIPPYAIVAGVPAKIIKYRFEEKVIDALLHLKWWDYTDDQLRKAFNELAAIGSLESVEKLREKLSGV